MYKNTKEKGITLVVLVITIILLLILAGITISYITGGGLIDKTQVAMNEYENADKKQQDIIDDINDYNKQEIDLEPVYSEEGAEDNIAPAELFEYEIINDGSVATTYMDRLPSKTARITGIKQEYINGYDAEQDKIIDTNYEIEHEGVKDILIIPYQVRLNKDGQLVENGDTTQDSELYKITEVNLSIYGTGRYGGYQRFPDIRKIVYPNTVEKTMYSEEPDFYRTGNEYIKDNLYEIVLSNNIDTINRYEFSELNLWKIDIPNRVTKIEEGAFYDCRWLQEIRLPDSLEIIGTDAFYECTRLTEITIPKNVVDIGDGAFKYSGLTKVNIEGNLKTIGEYAFNGCDGIKEIIIPGDIEYIGDRAFQNWGEDQTIYFECSESNEIDWYWRLGQEL